MIHLKTLKKQPIQVDTFPYHIPIIQSLQTITFTSDMTFLVGENGSGKSTLLEAIACAVGSPAIGSEHIERDRTLESIRAFAKTLHLTWAKKTHRGFFMRSEDFFGFVKRVSQMREELQSELRRIDDDYQGRSEMAKGLAKMPHMRELHALEQSYGTDLDAYSHGESYFKLFQSRFVPGGLYLLDEPEAPLSPMRQLSLLAMLKLMVEQDAQFIIATHSPILMAYPGATILSFDGDAIQPVAYDDLEHVVITRSFLNNPEAFLKHLII